HQQPIADVVDEPAAPHEPEVACAPRRDARRALDELFGHPRSVLVNASSDRRTERASAGGSFRAAPRSGRTMASIASMASRSSSAVTINAYVENAATSCHSSGTSSRWLR